MTLTVNKATPALASLLDAVEQGEEIILERQGIRFRLSLEPRIPTGSPLIVEDPEVLAGDWTWCSDDTGQLTFQPRRAQV